MSVKSLQTGQYVFLLPNFVSECPVAQLLDRNYEPDLAAALNIFVYLSALDSVNLRQTNLSCVGGNVRFEVRVTNENGAATNGAFQYAVGLQSNSASTD